MDSLNEVCVALVKDVDDALGAAIIDLSSGLMIAVENSVPYFTQACMDAVAAAAVEMFRGKAIVAVEEMLSNLRGNELTQMMQEVQMTTERTYHFMSIVPGKPNSLVILITGRRANLSMSWASLRSRMEEISQLCP